MQGQQFRRTGKVFNGAGSVKVALGFWLLLLFARCANSNRLELLRRLGLRMHRTVGGSRQTNEGAMR
jgi:hypothetical protein